MGRLQLVLAVLAGCYSPKHIADCELSCSANDCPGGFSCDTTIGLCRAAGATGACHPADAGLPIDTPDAPAGCWNGFAPTNYDPCATLTFPPLESDVGIAAKATIDTDARTLAVGSLTATSFGVPYTFGGAPEVTLVHVHVFVVQAIASVTVVGAHPLLIAADDHIEIDGVLDATAANLGDGGCPFATPDDSEATGPGGQGGGYGIAGGKGGDGLTSDSTDIPGPAGMAPNGADAITPLRSGCGGGRGGNGTSTTGAPGGLAGGAIELSSAHMVTIAGAVYSDGGGGGIGEIFSMATSGGGGGGTGGAILIEAPTVIFAGNPEVCAVGGGGASGTEPQTPSPATAGLGCTPGTGGKSTTTALKGGDGGGAGPGDDGDAALGHVGAAGGGGGGGRIRIRSTMQAGVMPRVIPPAT